MATYYPPVGFHFRVDFGVPGLLNNDARWMEVSGLTQSISPQSVKEAGVNSFSHKLPDRGEFSSLTLKRGLYVDSIVYAWVKAALDFQIYVPIPVTVSLLNDKHIPVAVWLFMRCYPTKWGVSDFNAKQSDLVIETLELNYAYFFQLTIPGMGVSGEVSFSASIG